MKGITKTFKTETKEHKRWFLGMLSGTLGANLLGVVWVIMIARTFL